MTRQQKFSRYPTQRPFPEARVAIAARDNQISTRRPCMSENKARDIDAQRCLHNGLRLDAVPIQMLGDQLQALSRRLGIHVIHQGQDVD